MNQLTFQYDVEHASFGAPIISDANRTAITMLDAWLSTEKKPLHEGGFIVTGPRGAGKSFLLDTEARKTESLYLAGGALPEKSTALMFLDDAHLIGAEQLLAFYHDCVTAGHRFVLSGKGAVKDWAHTDEGVLPDLMTRLAALPMVHLPAPDEDLLAQVFTQTLARKQVRIDTQTARAAAQSLRRSHHAAVGFALMIDEQALAEKRTIDKAFVREVLKNAPEFSVHA